MPTDIKDHAVLGDWLAVPSWAQSIGKRHYKQVRRQRHQPDLEDSIEYGRYLRGSDSE